MGVHTARAAVAAPRREPGARTLGASESRSPMWAYRSIDAPASDGDAGRRPAGVRRRRTCWRSRARRARAGCAAPDARPPPRASRRRTTGATQTLTTLTCETFTDETLCEEADEAVEGSTAAGARAPRRQRASAPPAAAPGPRVGARARARDVVRLGQRLHDRGPVHPPRALPAQRDGAPRRRGEAPRRPRRRRRRPSRSGRAAAMQHAARKRAQGSTRARRPPSASPPPTAAAPDAGHRAPVPTIPASVCSSHAAPDRRADAAADVVADVPADDGADDADAPRGRDARPPRRRLGRVERRLATSVVHAEPGQVQRQRVHRVVQPAPVEVQRQPLRTPRLVRVRVPAARARPAPRFLSFDCVVLSDLEK